MSALALSRDLGGESHVHSSPVLTPSGLCCVITSPSLGTGPPGFSLVSFPAETSRGR